MLDSDLATLYGVETKVLNQAVSRNAARFPERFCFRLTRDESNILRSQFVTSCADLHEFGSGGRRYLPRVFTEQGVAMLSSVLRSEAAIEVSIRIMDAFVEMRHFVTNNALLFEQVRSIELRQLEYQKTTDERFERVFDYMETFNLPRQKVFFEGQIYDAFTLLAMLVQRARKSIVLIDSYVDIGTLNILAKKRAGVEVEIWTHTKSHLSQKDVDTFNAQYPHLTLKHSNAFHDRFLILDVENGYLVGASLKDAGKKTFAVTRIEDESIVHEVLKRLRGR